jgi:UrcA family protein
MKHGIFAAMAAIGLVAAAQPAFAESKAVTYSDLDLSTPEGMAQLDARIDLAAKNVCGFNEDKFGSRMPSREARACYKEARADIAKRIAQLTGKKVASR